MEKLPRRALRKRALVAAVSCVEAERLKNDEKYAEPQKLQRIGQASQEDGGSEKVLCSGGRRRKSVSALTAIDALQTGTISVDVNKMPIEVTLNTVPHEALGAKKCRRRKVGFPKIGSR